MGANLIERGVSKRKLSAAVLADYLAWSKTVEKPSGVKYVNARRHDKRIGQLEFNTLRDSSHAEILAFVEPKAQPKK